MIILVQINKFDYQKEEKYSTIYFKLNSLETWEALKNCGFSQFISKSLKWLTKTNETDTQTHINNKNQNFTNDEMKNSSKSISESKYIINTSGI
jgi:hypothetical protein